MILNLPFFGGSAKAEPQHDPWPPTWRLPSGALQVEVSYKEPARQKLVDKSTRAVAFLALMVAVLGHAQWPFPELTSLILQIVGAEASVPLPELITARVIVGLLVIGTIVGVYRLILATLGLDRRPASVTFGHDRILIGGQSFDRRVGHSFDLEPHHEAKREDHRDRQQKISTPLYYRDSYTLTFQYGERRIEIAEILGKKPAVKLVARLQGLQKTPIPVPEAQRTSTHEQRA